MEGGCEDAVAWSSIGELERAHMTLEEASVAHVIYPSDDKKSFTYVIARRATFVRYTCGHFSKERTVRTNKTELAAVSQELSTYRRPSFCPPGVAVPEQCVICGWRREEQTYPAHGRSELLLPALRRREKRGFEFSNVVRRGP